MQLPRFFLWTFSSIISFSHDASAHSFFYSFAPSLHHLTFTFKARGLSDTKLGIRWRTSPTFLRFLNVDYISAMNVYFELYFVPCYTPQTCPVPGRCGIGRLPSPDCSSPCAREHPLLPTHWQTLLVCLSLQQGGYRSQFTSTITAVQSHLTHGTS